jgi:hypothetical protein
VEQIIEEHGVVYAILLRASSGGEGIKFFGSPELSLQMGYMNRPVGHVIQPHVHNDVSRDLRTTYEVLFIRSGNARLDLYRANRSYIGSVMLNERDAVLLANGGHGLVMQENTEIVEVKQGPFSSLDKERFPPVEDVLVSFPFESA